MLHHIDLLKDKVDGLNVTDNQSAVMRMGSLVVSGEIVRRGGDPVFQTTCRDRNRSGPAVRPAVGGLPGHHQRALPHRRPSGGGRPQAGQGRVRLRLRPPHPVLQEDERRRRLGGQRAGRQDRLLRRRRGDPGVRPAGAATLQVRAQGGGRGRLLPDPSRLRHGQLPALHGEGPRDHRRHQGQDHGRSGGAHRRWAWPST